MGAEVEELRAAVAELSSVNRRGLAVAFAEQRDRAEGRLRDVWSALAVLVANVDDEQRIAFQRLADDVLGLEWPSDS